MNSPEKVRIVEVGPRDGLQNEAETISVATKLEFIRQLTEAGLNEIEVGAFVRPDRVPQMADSDEVAAKLLDIQLTSGLTRYVALVPNEKGLVRALNANIKHIAIFTAASEAFAQVNIGMTVDESLKTFAKLAETARRQGISVRGYVSTAWWCPYAGKISAEQTRHVVASLFEMGCREVSVADTIGAATPAEVFNLFEFLSDEEPIDRLAAHFHDTRGTALANVLAALEAGITVIDASAGGLGGCPFAPGAQGNLATEDLLFMLHGMGIETGVNLDKVRAASRFVETVFKRKLPSRYLQAGPFSKRD